MHYKLRPSSALRWVTLAFALCCAYAVWRALAPRAGAAVGVSAAFITAFMLVCFARRADARRPVAIQIGQHDVTTWHRVGESVRSARLIDVNYWNRCLLSMTLQDD